MFETLTNWCYLPTPIGNFRMYDSGNEDIRIITFGDIFSFKNGDILRIHSSCIASEIFGAKDCDCADQLKEAMKLIAHEKSGLIIHLNQEGRGQGLTSKIKAVNLMQSLGVDTFDAFEQLNFEQDIRTYVPAVKILKYLGVNSIRLISNNPRKAAFLEQNGLSVLPLKTHPNIRPENKDYLLTKNHKLGHTLPLKALDYGSINFYHSDQPWGELSNFSNHAIFIKNKIWPTVEHFYQAQKFTGTNIEERIRLAATPTLAKQLANEVDQSLMRPNWVEIKIDIMLEGLKAKFTQHPDLRSKLVSSGERYLVEYTTNDSFWGDCGEGTGTNHLGKLLMSLRTEFTSDNFNYYSITG
ncbi:GTP cyclohydrolase II RibA [Shewanella frigidimarina]|uniref:GTP cyclohydrolase II RibA n=1 Tax=Shewanella frigidimarina TaxID=56812 RepID=UPI0009E9DD5A|nr:GTP cyclohydrolase II RibA [Shewanella frigidimarina]